MEGKPEATVSLEIKPVLPGENEEATLNPNGCDVKGLKGVSPPKYIVVDGVSPQITI